MRRRLALIPAVVLAMLALGPSTAAGDPNNAAATFDLVMDVPNIAEAPNGDRVAVTGRGTFSVHPKSVTASGGFTHTDSAGNVLGSGTWTADELLSFEFYGCGIVESLGVVLPPDFCGGALKLDVTLTPTGTTLAIPGQLTIFCVIGPQAPESHDNPLEGEEGVRLVIPGALNFNRVVSGMNVYIQTA